MSNTPDFKVKNGLSVGTSITAIGSLTTAGQTFPAADGSTGQYLRTDGSGALSWGTVSTSLNITDGTTTDTVGLTETVTFTGGTNITLAVTDNTITINNDHVNSSDITENTNLFFTDARAIAAIQGAADLTIDGGTIYVDTSANRVGIVDTSPQQTLDVGGNIGVNGTEVINSSSQIVGAVLDSAMTVGGSLAGVLSNLKIQYGTSYSGTPIQGSFFFDSLNQKLKVYTGSAFVDAVPAGGGGGGGGGSSDANTTFRNYSYTLTGTTSAVTGVDDNEIDAGAFIIGHKYTITSVGNTSFTGIGASGNTIGVVFIATGAGTGTGKAKQTLFYDTTSASTRVVAYVNGIKQVYGSGRDFVATTGTSVAFTYNLGSGDTIDIQVYELLTNAAYYLKSEVYTQAQVNSQISTGVSSYLPLTGGVLTDDLAINNGSPELYFGTTGNHYNWRIAAQEAVDTAFEISVGSQDTDYSNDTYTPKLVVKANGQVGIGTTSPVSNLHISQTANSGNNYRHGQIIIGNAANSGMAIAYNGISSGRTSITGLNNSGGANAQLSLGFGAVTSAGVPTTNVMTLNQSGNVGIGTTAPTSQLDVRGGAFSNGNVYIKQDVATNNPTLFIHQVGQGGNAGVNQGLLIKVDGQNTGDGNMIRAIGTNSNLNGGTDIDAFTVQNGGNVGIGTADPIAVLDVRGSGTSTSPNIAITTNNSDNFNHAINAFNPNLTAGEQNIIVVGKSGSTKNAGYMGYIWNGAGYDANLLTFGHWASDNLMNLRADGKLGIGTSTPSEKLTISNGSINLETNNSYIKGAGHNVLQVDATRTYYYGGTNGVQFRTADNANSLVSINNGGAISMHGTGTEAYIGRLALNVASTTADGVYVRNSAGGGNLDLVTLGSSYSSHGAAPNDTWLYSSNDINIGGATGNSNDVKILGNGGERWRMKSTGVQLQNGVGRRTYSGVAAGSATVTIVLNHSNQATFKVTAGANHYGIITSYGCVHEGMYGNGSGGLYSVQVQNHTSGTHGGWTVTRNSNTAVTITKTAGTYGGTGYYYVIVEGASLT